ncbi:MAG: TolC family protein [Methylotenera sp.]
MCKKNRRYGLGDLSKFQFKNLVTTLISIYFIIFSAFVYSSTPCETAAPPSILSKEIALNRLLQCNLDIVDSRRFIVANEANLTMSGQKQNPNLIIGVGNINPKFGIGAGSYFDKTIDSSVRYEQLIERGNKRSLRVKSAQGQVAASKQDVLDIERQQSIALLRAMIDLAANNERVNLLSQVVALYEETLHANTIRAEKGDLPPIDAQRQKIDANRAEIELRQAKSDTKAAQLTLATLLAWESKADALTVDSSILDIAPLETNKFVVTNRADIKAAQLRVEAAKSQLDLAQAQRKPDITAGVQYDHWPTSASNTTGTGDTISFTVGIPLEINHRYEGEIALANSNYDAANEALAHIEANAKIEWQRINADVTNAEASLQILQIEQLPRAEDVARTIELGYKKGALNLLDLLDARRMLRQTSLDTLAARANLARAIVVRNQSISANNVN